MRTASGTVNVNYLFDSAGRWIAFRKRQYVFNCDSQWIGWTPWGDNEVYSPNGSYVGTITYGNRLYYYQQREDRGLPGTVEPPPFPGTYSEPVSPGRAVLLPWAEDLDFSSFNDEMDWSSDLGNDVVQDLGFTSSISFYRKKDKKEVYNAARTENLPTLDLDVDSLSQPEPAPVHTPSSENERNISRRRYDDDYDDYDRRPARNRSRYEDEYDDYDRRPARPKSRYDEDDYDDRRRQSAQSRRNEEDEEFNRKKEIDRLRLIISKHAQRAEDENDPLSQPLNYKKSN